MKTTANYFWSFSKINLLIFVTNFIYIASALLGIYKDNAEFFVENAFQAVDIIFYCFVLLSFLFIKNEKLYFLISLFLILDLPVNLKLSLQGLLIKYLNFPGGPANQFVTYALLFCIFGLVVFLVVKFNSVRYFQIYLLIFYSISLINIAFRSKKVNNPSLRLGNQVSSISKNYYFFLFDEYPNEQVIRKYNLCEPTSYPSVLLGRESFINDQNVYSNFISTEKSTLTFLTGSFQADYNVNKTIHAIYNNAFAKGTNYSFYTYSLFDNEHRPNSEFSVFYFKDFNNLSTRKLIPSAIKLFTGKGLGRATDWEVYNAGTIGKLAALSSLKRRHVVYMHFFTPHIYPLVWGQPMSERIKNANQWMLKAIKLLDENDPKAGVVIFSDHGLREPYIRNKLWNKNLLYFRNIKIDTTLVNKNGLVDLIKSINY